MAITANDMKLLAQHGTSWTARATRGQNHWSVVVRGSHQAQHESEYEGVVTRTGQVREWKTLDALYNWCALYGVALLTLDVDRAVLADIKNRDQQPLPLPKPSKSAR